MEIILGNDKSTLEKQKKALVKLIKADKNNKDLLYHVQALDAVKSKLESL